MADYPKTRHEMRRAKYEFLGTAECKRCHAEIEWWKTTNGRKMPFDPIASDHCEAFPHFGTCKASAEPPAAPQAQKVAGNSLSIGDRIQQLIRSSGGVRVVAVVTAQGVEAAWANGIDAEELRHDLISAANFVRSEVNKKEGAAR